MYKPGFLVSFESEGPAAVGQDPYAPRWARELQFTTAHLPLSPHRSSHSWRLTLLLTEH